MHPFTETLPYIRSTAIKIAAVAGAAALAIGVAWSFSSWLDAVGPKPTESEETKAQEIEPKSECVDGWLELQSGPAFGKDDELPRDPIPDRVGLSHPEGTNSGLLQQEESDLTMVRLRAR
ncbi:uncharacterized protein A4U43_UnF2530 [Asparagus officinalis]|uniref:Uncharacterized protein n=1 Tax=Asparagus officinalis TaxID=4686 RepID=A0A1R3L781_ASPOF|nr:uncharacterized protein A4U43_UnF2530 [Asparagus officinalis]